MLDSINRENDRELLPEDAKGTMFLERLDELSKKTGISRIGLINKANGWIGNDKTGWVATGEMLIRPPVINTNRWGIPGLCGMHSAVKIFGDTEATEQTMIQLCTALAFGGKTFCDEEPIRNRNGLFLTANITSYAIQSAIRESISRLGYSEDMLAFRDAHGGILQNSVQKDRDGISFHTLDRTRIASITDMREDGQGKTLWIEQSWSPSSHTAFPSGKQMLVDAVESLKKAVSDRHLGFIAFETPRPHFNKLRDCREFFNACRKLANEAGVTVIVRFIWDEHNQKIAEKALYGTDEEQEDFSPEMRSYISAMEQQTRNPPFIEAFHNPADGNISISIVDAGDEGKTTAIPYLDTKIQRSGKDRELGGSEEMDI